MTQDELQAQLDAVYASTSWKITAPLRWAGHVVMIIRHGLRRVSASPRAFVRRVGLGMARRVVTVVKRRPILRDSALRFRRKFPVAWERLSCLLNPTLISPAIRTDEEPVVVTLNSAYVWNPGTQAEHFKVLLSQALRQRQK